MASYRTIQGLLLPRPATCSWHCLHDTRLGFPPISFQQATLLLHQKQRECGSSQWGAPSPSSPLLLPVGSQQPRKPQAWHRVESAALRCLSPSWRTTHHNRRRLVCQECPCLKQGRLRDPGSFSVLSGNRSDSQVLPAGCTLAPSLSSLFSSLRLRMDYPPLGFLCFQG